MIFWAHNPHIWIVFHSMHSLSAGENAVDYRENLL